MKTLFSIIMGGFLVSGMAGCWAVRKTDEKFPSPQNVTTNLQIPLGNPSMAANDRNNLLLVNDYFSLSFNCDLGTPNWVGWKLEKSDFGTIERLNNFRPDERLPAGCTVRPFDYGDRDWSRGHQCPSADRTVSREANDATFLMTNMLPQTDDLNQGPWEKLESYSRSLARRGRILYIYSGGYGSRAIMKRRVNVPTNMWKVIVVTDTGFGEISEETRVIAVDMPNHPGIRLTGWRQYLTTVREIEKMTGLNLLSSLSADLQNSLETKKDFR